MQRRTGISGGITTRRSLGITLALTSAILFSTAGIFTKSVAADALSVIFWRGIFGGVAGLTLLFITRRFWHELAAMRGVGWVLALINASGTIAFISSFKLTSVANVTLVWSTVPILGGFIGWVWFGERVSLAFFASCLLVFIGVFFLFGADIASLDLASGSLVGSLLAFWMTLMMALLMAVYRRYPDAPTTMPGVMASLMLMIIALIWTRPLAIAPAEIGIVAGFGVIFYAASLTIAIGSKYIASGEAGLLSVVETPSAILLALLILHEVPGVNTLIGGSIILAAVLFHPLHTPTRRR